MFPSHHDIVQILVNTSLISTILGILPIICAIPAAIYYTILVTEKITGKKFSDLLKRKSK